METVAWTYVEELVNRNIGLVHDEAKKYSYLLAGADTSLEFEDLVQEGMMALYKAAEKFDGTRGSDFTCFAEGIIRQHLRRAVCNQSRLVRIPEGQFDTYAKIQQVIGELREEGISEPVLNEISRRSGIPVSKIDYVIRNIETGRNTVSLNTPLSASEDEDDAPDRIELLADVYEDPAEKMAEAKVGEAFKGLLSVISGRELQVITMRYGLDDGEAKTLKEIASKLGISAERVRQIEKSALESLRNSSALDEIRKLM